MHPRNFHNVEQFISSLTAKCVKRQQPVFKFIGLGCDNNSAVTVPLSTLFRSVEY